MSLDTIRGIQVIEQIKLDTVAPSLAILIFAIIAVIGIIFWVAAIRAHDRQMVPMLLVISAIFSIILFACDVARINGYNPCTRIYVEQDADIVSLYKYYNVIWMDESSMVVYPK